MLNSELNLGPSGVADAVERYGRPLELEADIPVSLKTLDYWRGLKDGRTAEVVLLVRRLNGRYLLHTKAFYPQGAYRLLTGGIHAGEDLIRAAMREATEETGLAVQVQRFLGVLRQRFLGDGQAFCFTSYLIELTEQGGTLGALDEDEGICGFSEVAPGELISVALALETLPESWRDWGMIRGGAHRLAARVLLGEDVA